MYWGRNAGESVSSGLDLAVAPSNVVSPPTWHFTQASSGNNIELSSVRLQESLYFYSDQRLMTAGSGQPSPQLTAVSLPVIASKRQQVRFSYSLIKLKHAGLHIPHFSFRHPITRPGQSVAL